MPKDETSRFRTSAKRKYNILAEFYYDAMQQFSDKCDEPP
jgi:hypothetical protein